MWNFTSVRLRVRVFAVLLAALILLPFATQGAAADTVSCALKLQITTVFLNGLEFERIHPSTRVSLVL